MIDSKTGILKKNRLIGLNNRFSKILKNEIDKQMELPVIKRDEYAHVLNNVYRNYSIKDMVNNALITYSSR